MKSHVKTTCVSSNKKSSGLPVKNDMTDEQTLVFQDGNVSQGYFIVEDCEQEGNSRASVFGWSEIILDLCDSVKKKHAKIILVSAASRKFELNGTRKTLKDVSGCIRSVCDMVSESLKTTNFRNYLRQLMEQLHRRYRMCTKEMWLRHCGIK